VTLFDALRAFFQEHQYCGELYSGVEGDRVWMTWPYTIFLARVPSSSTWTVVFDNGKALLATRAIAAPVGRCARE